jgi:UDP-N-acetyl-2-amino-2-deoxyglucuronate dehydrogenase
MSKNEKIVALVGCGRVAKRHLEALNDTGGIKLGLACDIDESKAKSVSQEFDVPYLTDYKKIRDVDIIAVLTPSGMHPRHVAEIAETTDIPYIVCEKPISLTLREAYEMLRRINRADKTLLPVYQNRYNPLVVMVKELISSGQLGEVHQFVCNIFWNRNDEYFNIDWHGTKELDGGVLYTQASHYVDMVHFFFGDVNEHKGIGGTLRNLEVQDSVSAVCKFESGTVGSINATVSTFRQNFMTEFTLIAEKGTIRLSGTNLNTIDFWDLNGIKKPNMDFKLDHVYGKGHDTMYKYIAEEKWEMFPSHQDVLSGIRLMELLSY